MIKKIIINILTFIILIFGMAYFKYIPLELFQIDINTFNQTSKIIYSLCADIGYIIIVFFLYKDILINNFKEYIKNFKENFELSFKYYFIGLVIMIITNLIINIFFTNANANNEQAVRSLINIYPYYMIFSVSIYAPLIEELIFRKSIKDIFITSKNNKIIKYIYILTSGLIFASMHVLGSVTSSQDYLYIIPYASLGISFAMLYYKTNNIFSTICMHSLHNTIAIILYLMIGV